MDNILKDTMIVYLLCQIHRLHRIPVEKIKNKDFKNLILF